MCMLLKLGQACWDFFAHRLGHVYNHQEVREVVEMFFLTIQQLISQLELMSIFSVNVVVTLHKFRVFRALIVTF